MSNYYTQFSEEITHITDKEIAWLKAVLTDGTAENASFVVRHKDETDMEHFPDFGWDIKPTTHWDADKGELITDTDHFLWLYSEESGDIDQLALVVQEFLKEFTPQSCFSLSWASWCDKLEIESFHGGAIFVTAKDIKHTHTGDWLEQERKRFALENEG